MEKEKIITRKISKYFISSLTLIYLSLINYSHGVSQVKIDGELRKWHKISLIFDGPQSSETGSPNPFSDYNLEVTFTQGGTSYQVPGYFAADGDAANSSAKSGNKWIAHFAPDKTGTWSYSVVFKKGKDVAINGGGTSAGFMDGTTGSFTIASSNKKGKDLRAKGRLLVVGKHYPQFADSKEWFVKGGPDAPENMLSYVDFDDTPKGNYNKNWAPHSQDYNQSDAGAYTWKNGKGKNILGSIAYLSGKGVNAFSFLTFSLDGDDKTVFPHVQNGGKNWNNVYHDRFDVSKMGQWEKVFEYADKKGMFLHFKTQETENDQKMDGGAVGRERKLYYRELIARFGHHLALNWNLGEENTQTNQQRKEMAKFFAENDPYQHLVVIHTFPGQRDQVYDPLVGNQSSLTGVSIQTANSTFSEVHDAALSWVEKSAKAGKPWIVAVDEPGSASIGTDKDPKDRKLVRSKVLWATLMAGGVGVEYYYGYQTGCSDLTCQDHRTRDEKYTDVAHALKFFQTYFQKYLPDVINDNAATANKDDYVLKTKNESAFAVYLPNGGNTNIDIPNGNWTVSWYNPRTGSMGGAKNVTNKSLQAPDKNDWVAFVTNGNPPDPSPEPDPVDPPEPDPQPQPTPTTCKEYTEVDGLVIMEAENTQSNLGLWINKKDVADYTGSGHIEFTGNSITNGPPKSPLRYTFTINKSGYYQLTIRARKRLETGRTDLSNDGYVRVEGDFGEGPNAGNKHKDDAPLSLLKKDLKLYGGNADGWGWAVELDAGGHSNKRNPVYNFKAGETYTLVISGRSKNWNIDRIVFYHKKDAGVNKARNTDLPETTCKDNPQPDPQPDPKPDPQPDPKPDPTPGTDCNTQYSFNALNTFSPSNEQGFVPYYKDNSRKALAVNAKEYKDQFSAAQFTFQGVSGSYHITLNTLLETDGESVYRLLVGNKKVGEFQNLETNTDYQAYAFTFENVKVNKGDIIRVEFNSDTNGKIPEGNGTAYSRGRWTKLGFVCTDSDPQPQPDPTPDPQPDPAPNPQPEPNPSDDCDAEYTLSAISDFAYKNNSGYVPAYVDAGRKALAINSDLYKDKVAAAITTFEGQNGTYDIKLNTMLERDGESTYKLYVNEALVASYTNPESDKDYAKHSYVLRNINIENGDELKLEFNTISNGKVPLRGAYDFSRGRWLSMELSCVGNNSPDKSPSKDAKLIPGTIQAEDYDKQKGIKTEKTTDAGGGTNVGWINNGDYMEYLVDVQKSATYIVEFRVASNTKGGNLILKKGTQTLTESKIENTGGWQKWITLTATVPLEEGEQTISLECEGVRGYLFNVNWVKFYESKNNSFLDVGQTPEEVSIKVNAYPNPFNDVLNLDLTDFEEQIELTLFNIQGKEVWSRIMEPGVHTIDESQLKMARGMYILSVQTSRDRHLLKIQKQ